MVESFRGCDVRTGGEREREDGEAHPGSILCSSRWPFSTSKEPKDLQMFISWPRTTISVNLVPFLLKAFSR